MNEDKPPPKMLLSVEEAAGVLSISESKMWELVRRGEVPVLRIPPRNTRVAVKDLEAYVEHLRQAAKG